MHKSPTKAFLFLAIFICVAGCAATKPNINKQSDWQTLPSNDGTTGAILFNIKTNASIAISFTPAGKKIWNEAESLALKMMNDNPSIVALPPDPTADNPDQLTFRWLSFSLPQEKSATDPEVVVVKMGFCTVKNIGQSLPWMVFIGSWPTEFDETMTRDYQEIVNSFSVKNAPRSK